MDTDLIDPNIHPNPPTLFKQVIPPPTRNNLKPVNSPLRRPLSPSENDVSENETIDHSSNINITGNSKKKVKQHRDDNQQQQDFSLPFDATATVPSPLGQQHQQQNTNTNASTCITDQVGHIPQNKVTDEAKAFAQSRYPFPPFIIRFSTPRINDQKITDELCKFIKANHNCDLELSGFRKSTTKCSINESDLLIFVKNSCSFSTLINENNWPKSILGLTYTRPSIPATPPQLSLIIKNVSLSINFTEFANDIKSSYSNVSNVIRMKNKNQTIIKLIKVEFSDYAQRDEILNRGKIFVNALTYDVDEYLAPARVLICSKCMGIGHFRKQCKQEQDTCRKCGDTTTDMKKHMETCSQIKCKHCNGDHMSNDMRCPTVKQFRADLTKHLLTPASQANPIINHYDLTATNFPPMNPAQRSTIFKNNTPHGPPTTTQQWSNNIKTGAGDLQHCKQVFSKYKTFYQKGENANGGTIVLVRNEIKTVRIPCDIPNVCVIDVIDGKPLRIIGIYAPESKSWSWDSLSPLVTDKCVFLGDFNVDIEQDKAKAETFITWLDSLFLTPYLPAKPTSKRSKRIIDFALSTGFSIAIQTHESGTSSDHKPILAVVPTMAKETSFAKNTRWNVFSMVAEYNIYYPHPYTDAPEAEAENYYEKIPLATVEEVLDVVLAKKKKKSCDAHALSNYIFKDILQRRGLLPDTQSGFREDFRLQTRVLLFFEQVASLMANSSPVATIFVDFKAAFDQLWFEGCIGGCLSHFFADDLAAILAGSIGIKYTLQCLDLERKLKVFLENLEYYSILTAQPINFSKTEGLWSARAIGAPKFELNALNSDLQWTNNFKYLGYWITPKLGFGKMIDKSMQKIRQTNRMFKLAKEFFQLPLDAKLRHSINPTSYRGYLTVGRENLDSTNSTLVDEKEAFKIGQPELNNKDQFPELFSRDENFHLIDEFFHSCYNLCLRLFEHLAETFEINRDYFTSIHQWDKEPGATLKLLHYPPINKTNSIRAGAHSDYGSLTLLFQHDNKSGLEVFDRSTNQWYPVEARDDMIVVNFGDVFEYWSKGMIKSTIHRVNLPTREQENDSRYSIAFFCDPNGDTLLTPIPSKLIENLIYTKDQHATHVFTHDNEHILTAGEHLQMRLNKTHTY
ncbi:hypothetical protein I4U23_011690 [Adineta vaga]|nr:hypothetical protein I4U23_011690 [Adineta vaga]